MTFRPHFLRPSLSDPFWTAAALVIAVVLAVQSCRMLLTSSEEREAERERLELIRDGE